jgi:hypothetical protein
LTTSGPARNSDGLLLAGLFLVIGLALLIGSKFAAADTLSIDDAAIRQLVRGNVVRTVRFDEVVSVEQEDRPRYSTWFVRSDPKTAIPMGAEYGDWAIMRAMLAERLPPHLVPEAWEELRLELR